jgi:hypothetical protein
MSRQVSDDPNEAQETRELVISAFALGRALGITTILVLADEITDRHLVESVRQTERVIWIARDRTDIPAANLSKDTVLVMPDASLNRLSQLNLALFLAALNGLISSDERVLGLSGVAGSRRLDTLVIAKPSRDYPWLLRHRADLDVSHQLARLLEIALQMARQGREGSPIGTIFVLGNRDDLAPYLRQLILNPMQGHSASARSIHNPKLFETLRELAALDGAFIVEQSGIVESAGTYLDAVIGRGQLAPGLGARHAAALAITVVTDATSIAISASSGTVSVYYGGETVLTLDGVQSTS